MENIIFVNNTPYPVIVETWMKTGLYGLSQLREIIVSEYQEIQLYSLTGEWYITSMFTNNEMANKWKIQNLPLTHIGKFRSSPCARGDYHWMNIDKYFDMFYDKKTQKIHFYVENLLTKDHDCKVP